MTTRWTCSCLIVLFVAAGCTDGDNRRSPSDDPSGDNTPDTTATDGNSPNTPDTTPPDTTPDTSRDTSSAVRFRITSPRSDQPVEYRLHVVTQPSKIRDGSRFQAETDNDTITPTSDYWVIEGETGTAPSADKVHGDSYTWSPSPDTQFAIAGWRANTETADYTITINGNSIDPSNLPRIELDTSPCVGGGTCYGNPVDASSADHTVGPSADRASLQSKLDAATAGDVVFIDPSATINLGYFPDQPSIVIPSGVTLASDRGVNGSDGALLVGEKKPGSDWQGSDTIRLQDDTRLTGLRIEGPTPNRQMNWLGADHDYTDGIDVSGSGNVEIDNNELYGWPYASVSGGDTVHVHHNFIHDNDQSGLGYGVSSTEWDSVIEYNRFQRNRHAVAGSGDQGEGYIVRYNTFGAEGIGGAGHKIDMHEHDNTGDAGSRMEIYRNTIKFPDAQGVYLRGTPRQNADIHHNWFFNPTEPCLTENEGGSYCAIQVRAPDFNNVTHHDNHYGDSEPDCSIGAPRSGC
jgi:hypothetical protein